MEEQECKNLLNSMGNQVVQDPGEFWWLVSMVQSISPKKALEVGTAAGGSLRFWQILCGQEGQSYGVDGGGTNVVDMSGYPQPIMIVGQSEDPEIIARAREHAPYDFVFIDADHSYEACKRDWENYSPMVRPGGIVGFHDYNHPPVKRVFDEITVGTKEFKNTKFGICVVRLPG
jgi:predicted O-methyltransferase YrrM